MGLPRILPLFLLPRLPRTARVLGELDSWREGLQQAQIELVDGNDADVVVAPSSLVREAAAVAPHGLILEGHARNGALRKQGFASRTWMAVPDRDAPESLLGMGTALTRYAVATGAGGRRARLGRGPAIALGLVGAPVVVASRDGSVPALLEAAAGVEPEVAGSSFLPVLGRWGDPLSRGVLLLFPPGEALPRWALKFARIPGNDGPFELAERGLGFAAAAGGTVAAHAPRLLGRFTVDRLSASLETASIGRRLLPVLDGTLAREKKLALIERIAGWTEAVARETSGRAGLVAPELIQQALAYRPEAAAIGEAVARLPSVFVHADLWPDNVLVEGETFAFIDWESARADGMPLSDLLYFFASALALVDGASFEAAKEEHFVRLHRGELPSSQLLFEWTRRLAEASSIPPDAVGPLATLRVLWLAAEDSRHAKRSAAAGTDLGVPLSVRHAERWLADPMLGPGWDRWRV